MIIFIAISTVLIWLLLLLGLVLFVPVKKGGPIASELPFVSIIISLRNEESNIRQLCESLAQLSYPNANFEILFGDDSSSDQTLVLLETFKPDNALVYAYPNIETNDYGKQKVLSALSKNARGDYLIFTDADMLFPRDWIQGLLTEKADKDYLMVGLTRVSGEKWAARMQNIDWLFNEQVVGMFAKLGLGLTAWGNNMLISKKVYEEVGGHSSLRKSIVEDIDLLRQVQKCGGKLVVNMDPGAVATTQPVQGIWRLLHQRKRWMTRVKGINPIFWFGYLTKIIFWPSLVYLSILSPVWLIGVCAALIIKWIGIKQIFAITNNNFSIIDLLIFEIYDFFFYLVTFAFYLMPIQIVWKGRRY